jgi:hypothetical protein
MKSTNIKAQIRRMDDQRLAAMAQGDADALDAMMDPQFYYTHFSGRTDDRAFYIRRIRSGSALYSGIRRSEDVILVHDDIALHRGRIEMHIALPHINSSVDIDSTFNAVWRHTSDGWKILAYVSTPRAKD